MNTFNLVYSKAARFIHLGLAGFGVGAYLTGELAEGGLATNGYLLHAYLGLSLLAVMFVRFGAGMSQSPSLGFRHWRLLSRHFWITVVMDIKGLFRLQVPEHARHEGLAGLVQALGLLIFFWMAATGTVLYVIGAQTALFEFTEELHEAGEGLIPLYLLLHVGAVILHTLVGKPVW